ncbi:hypothetical protein FHX42_001512 [Saccharopolyspora lacisalsi]|uniref:Peptide chain release factor 1 n=1 Tax=Halosaccharopolyspora lacisalsi TaxID=1000566 RepID=A0A839DSZ4_9PSEU|nr:hypothetical protein [Halosaccharopolyspora lacisalsi]MBA8824183.1 hypothetical protein [Halosaccharopolyspora lacisalsi]
MELTRLRSVYEYEGPFATVYLEGRSPGEDAGQQLRLRWKTLRERLDEAGAGAGVLDAVEASVTTAEAGEEQTNGRVLVATEAAGVVLDEPWDAALGAGDAAHWTRLPELGAYVREEARSVRMLVAIADEQHAVVRQEIVAEQHAPRDLKAETVEGGSDSRTHKPRGAALAHKQLQRRAEQAVEHNAEDIVAHLRTIEAGFRPRLLVLAGEMQGRTAIRDALPEGLAELHVDADRGGDQDEAAEQALAEQLRELAEHESTRNAQARAEQLNAGLAHGQAVHGDQAVARAAEMGAVDTLLLEYGTSLDREAFLLKVCADTSARADLVEAGTDLADGVGALLRFPLND